MRFSSHEEASSYAAKSAGRMAVKSAFGAEELRKISSVENFNVEGTNEPH
jgi:hypothetical protein